MQSLPTAGRWSVYIALAVLFAVACAFLAHWQFERNEERAAQLALVETNYDAEPIAWEQALAQGRFDPAQEWLPVVMTGRYLEADQLVVRNRPHGGTSAFEVLTPLLTDEGGIVIVDRGWVRPADEGTGPAAIPAPPSGEVTVVARLRPSEPLPTSGRSAPEGQVPTIHLPVVATQTGDETITSAYGILVSEDPAPADAPQPLEAPTADPGPHLSYAIQWILFAVMGFIFIFYVIRTETRHRHEDDEDTSAPGRRDRDADDEDAILDAAGPRR
ncbi:SURF1 family protein [Microbacterium sp. LRZ72]|uniref:SURF1 family cytochrome oxidase biogenesis protein n=1 Tax=Microbacterium sp. LRZ72 TaxID=2942481 RepID=UPI0029A967BB|nr:SURF1 family protein [Microbacterium sp. LRZ72]